MATTVLMVGLRGVAIAGTRGLSLAGTTGRAGLSLAGNAGRVGGTFAATGSRVTMAELLAEGEAAGATFFATEAGLGALTIGEIGTGTAVVAEAAAAALDTAVVGTTAVTETAAISTAAVAEAATISTAAVAETAAIGTAAIETTTLTTAAEASVIAAAEGGTAGAGTATAGGVVAAETNTVVAGVAGGTGATIGGIATGVGNTGLGDVIGNVAGRVGGAVTGVGMIVFGIYKLTAAVIGALNGAVQAAINAGASVATGAATGTGAGAGAAAVGATAAGGAAAGTHSTENEQLQLRQNERTDLARLIENDKRFRDQLRPWTNVYNAYDALDHWEKEIAIFHIADEDMWTWDTTQWDILEKEFRKALAEFRQSVGQALNRENVTNEEVLYFGDMERLLVSLGFNLDIFNSEDLERLRTAKNAFDNVKDELRRVTANGTTVDIRNQMIDTYAAALNNRFELVSRATEVAMHNRATQVSNVVAPILAAGASEAAAGYNGEVSEDLLNRRNYLSNYISSHVTGETGVDSDAAVIASTSPDSTTPSPVAPNASTPNPTTPSASNPQVTAPSSSGGIHPLFVPLLLGNIGQTVSAGRPQTNDVSMHHDLVWKSSGGNTNNYVPQQRDYVTPQTVDTTAVLLPLAALAALVLVR